MRQGVAIGTKVGQVAGVGRSAALTGTMCRPGLLLAGGLIVVHILAPSVAQSRMLFCIGLVKVLLAAAIPFADLIPLARGGAGGSFNDPLCTLKIMAQGRDGKGLCLGALPVCVFTFFAALNGFGTILCR